MKARFYDPDVGRFLNQDTYLGESTTPPSLHRYLYAYSNPTVYIDLFGYASKIYQWKDDNGKVHFGDTPPPNARIFGKVGDDYVKEERQSEFDKWCEQQGGENCDRFAYEKIKDQKAKQKGLLTTENAPVEVQDSCPVDTPKACAERERAKQIAKNFGDNIAAGGESLSSLNVAKGFYDLATSVPEIIQWMEENPGKSLAGAASLLCLAEPKCKAFAKNTSTRIVEEFKVAKGIEIAPGKFDYLRLFRILCQLKSIKKRSSR